MTVLDRCPRCGRGSAVESVGGEPPVQTTHAEGCWAWGQKHYSCAVREIERLRARVAEHEHDLSTSEGIRARIRDLEAEVEVLTIELEVVEEAEAEEAEAEAEEVPGG